jgi:hypothetical protein
VNWISMRWASGVIATVAGAWVCAGCGYAVTASDGTVFKQSKSVPDALPSALAASASRDLPCASENLQIERLEPEREYVISGCGLRVVYRVDTPTVATRRIELVSRSTVASAEVHRTDRKVAKAATGDDYRAGSAFSRSAKAAP